MTAAVVLCLDGASARHLGRALEAYRARCRGDGMPLPPALADLLAATTGQGRPDVEADEDMADDGRMTPLLLTYLEAGQRLRLSERSVRRLVAAGDLRAVEVGGRRRIHTADLEQYAERLRHGHPQEVTA